MLFYFNFKFKFKTILYGQNNYTFDRINEIQFV